MQEIEKDQEETKTTQAPADLTSQPLQPVIPQGADAQDDDPEEIFLNAVAEIDTQPLVQVKRRRAGTFTIADVLEVVFLVSVLLVGFFGILWQCITFPHTLVVLYAKANPASITTTLDVPTRTLAPITLTRSATSPTTGKGHQDAQAATGTLTFYNGQNTPQSVPVGTVLTGQDGVKIATSEPALVPAASLPNVGVVTIVARAIQAGSKGNIAPYDINFALTSVLTVKNQTSFTNGRDARDYQAVAQTDLVRYLATLCNTLEISLAEVLLRNKEKLYRRYPHGFSSERSINRTDWDDAASHTSEGRDQA